MTPFFTVVLLVAVVLIWRRITALERRMDQFVQALHDLKREAAAAANTPVAVPAPAPVQPVVASQAKPVAEPHVREVREIPEVREVREAPRPRVEPESLPLVPPVPPAPPAPPEPMLHEKLAEFIREYFTGGNLVVRVGVIVLFFGVAFLLKYAADHTQLSIQMRLVGVALGAVALFALGWVLRKRRRGFALALQGGAIGVAYLTLYAALRLYALLAPEMTFALMAALGVFSCLLAVRQDAQALAVLGATGGFLAPVLASTGQGNHVVLFGYYALLDVFIVAQAWFKAWRSLNLLAFVFTFGVGTAWGVLRYEPALFATTEPFLLFFFAAFIAIAILFAFRTAPRLGHYVDGTLVFGTPVVAMTLQMALVRDFHHGEAFSALGAGMLYLLLAVLLHYFQRETMRMLKESFVALGLAFLTLAVPLWLDDTWTSTTWALEGAALVWIGLRQGRWLPTVSGLLLQLIAAAAYVLRDFTPPAQYPLANADFMGALLLGVAGLLSARVSMRPDSILKPAGQVPSHLLLTWGLGWWFFASGNEVRQFVPEAWDAGAYLGLYAATALACAALARPLAWPALRVPALLLLPVMLVATWLWALLHLHPSSEGGALAWPAAFAVLWLSLRWPEETVPRKQAALLHGTAFWLLALLLGWEAGWQVQQVTVAGTVWSAAVWGLVPTIMLAALASGLVDRLWPLRVHAAAFRRWVACGFALFLVSWSVWLNCTSVGNAAPLSYLPLLNPLDVMAGLALFAVASWLAMAWRAGSAIFERNEQAVMIGVWAFATFIWLNAVLLRTMHYWTGVPYTIDALVADTAVHAALSIFWTLLALGTMLWANRTGLRAVWFGGAGLMAMVVAKLFLVDLVRVGTLPRIVSFLVVGGLMLVIGYFSPLPPSRKAEAA